MVYAMKINTFNFQACEVTAQQKKKKTIRNLRNPFKASDLACHIFSLQLPGVFYQIVCSENINKFICAIEL